jgi:hypothetical protein
VDPGDGWRFEELKETKDLNQIPQDFLVNDRSTVRSRLSCVAAKRCRNRAVGRDCNIALPDTTLRDMLTVIFPNRIEASIVTDQSACVPKATSACDCDEGCQVPRAGLKSGNIAQPRFQSRVTMLAAIHLLFSPTSLATPRSYTKLQNGKPRLTESIRCTS